MTDKILAWCRAQALLVPGDRVLLAVSGGADSTAMLHALAQLQEPLAITVEAAHFNHHLRGAQSDRDERFCLTLCARLGIKLHTGGADVGGFASENGLGLEESARKLRYEFLQQTARGAKIATGHNADDNLETMLMNLLRGCALRGLGGIPPVRGNIVRPLLCVDRQEILAYLCAHALTFVEDSSNQTDDFLRNRIRHNALPALRREDAALAGRALETALFLREDEAYLQRCTAQLLQAAALPGGYDAAQLLAAPPAVRRRALAIFLTQAGAHDLTRTHLCAAQALLSCANPAAQLDLPGAILRRQYHLVTTNPLPDASCVATQPVPIPGTLSLADGRLLRCARGIFTPGALPYPDAFALRPETLCGLTIRSRLPGDTLRGPGGSKSVKKWMIDRKIPAAQRCAVPILVSGGCVIAAFGLAADPAYRARPFEEAVLIYLETEKL